MKVLTDTQSIIWFSLNNPRLSKTARETLEHSENDCYVSMASFWEMSIKMNLGKLEMEGLTLEDFMDKVQANNFLNLSIRRDHILVNGQLPLHHRDPFDRLIISQALFEQMSIVSNDQAFDNYPIQRIW